MSECIACTDPKATVKESDNIPLCGTHWNWWLAKYDPFCGEEAPCGAHLILAPNMTPCYQRHELAPGVHVDVPHEHEGVTVKSMAEVIEDAAYTHQMTLFDFDVKVLVTALTAAGFGPVKAAAAGALLDAANEYHTPHYGAHAGRWLRTRAATIEAPDGP